MKAPFRDLVGMLAHRAARQPDSDAYTFLADGERPTASLTYAALDRKARAIAALLSEHGVEPGDRAVLLYPPGLEFIAAFFGALYAGVVAVPCYPPSPAQVRRGASRVAGVVADSDPAVVLCTAGIAALRGSTVETVPALAALRWVATDGESPDPDVWRRPDVGGDTLAFLQYTSGSTSSPRGVMVTHGNLLHNLAYAHEVEENDGTSVSVSWLPVIHDMGLIEGVLEPAYGGYPAYLMPPAAFTQSPIRWLRAIDRYRATNSGGPNFAFDLCVRGIPVEQRKTLDLSSWRVFCDGAEPIRAETLHSFHAAFAGSGFRWRAFYPVYGLAEATLLVSSGRQATEPVILRADADQLGSDRVLAAGDRGRSVDLVASGEAGSDTEIAIVDPQTRRRLPEGRVGEIWIASPSVTRGYWRRPDETRLAFGATIAGEGARPRLRSGDLGAAIDGRLFVVGRIKDVLIVRGTKHYPQDLEATAESQHPAIRPSCVAAFALSDEQRLGIAAEVVPGSNPSHRAIAAAIRRGIADVHGLVVHAVVLLAPGRLPKTTSGKLRRSACARALEAGDLHVA